MTAETESLDRQRTDRPPRRGLSDRFVIGPWIDPGDADGLRLSTLCHAYTLIGIVIFCGFGVVRSTDGHTDIALALWVGTALLTLNLLALRWTRRINWTSLLALFVGAGVILCIVMLDRDRPSRYLWALLFVAMPFFLLGHRRGLIVKLARVRILVVEDTAVSRKVAHKLLERHGCHVEVVTNGREAIGALESSRYDIVLMDCQMPEMDGLEATRIIRDPGSAVLDHSTPILALTAATSKGIRDECLVAGMNDYVTKPIKATALLDAIARLLPNVSDTEHDGRTPALDARRLLELADGDDGFVRELIRIFLEDGRAELKDMKTALAGEDTEAARRLAHKLKGSAGNIGAGSVRICAERIEEAIKGVDTKQVGLLLDTLAAELARVEATQTDSETS